LLNESPSGTKITTINPSIRDILLKVKSHEKDKFIGNSINPSPSRNQLISDDSISYFIGKQFDTRGHTRADSRKRKHSELKDKQRIQNKLDTLIKKDKTANYSDFFTNRFQTTDVDSSYHNLDTREKSQMIENVVELMDVNLKKINVRSRQIMGR
jgi:hypothetical protein